MKLNTRGFVFTILQTILVLAVQALPIDEYKKISANGKFGLALVATNEVIIDPVFDDIGWSDQGLTVIDGVIGFKENDTWGLVDLSGKKIFNAQYTTLYPLTKNLLVAGQRSRSSILSLYGIINTKGKILSEFEFNSLRPVGENAIVSKRVNNRSRAGFISASGKVIIPFEYESITSINKDLLAVENQQNLKAIFGVNGSQKSAFKFESIGPLDQGNFLVSLYNRKGVVDGNGTLILDPIYKSVSINNGKFTGSSFDKWTLLNAENQVRHSYFFDRILPITDKQYVVQTSDNIGIIDEDEHYINYFRKLKLIEADHELVVVKNENYFGLLDQNGKTVLPVQLDSVWIDEKLVFAKINKPDRQSWTPYDKQGKKVGYFQYEHFEKENATRLRANRNGKWGLLDFQGNEVSPFLYDTLGKFQGDLAKVYYLSNYGVINENGIWVVTPYKDDIVITDKNIVYKQGSENGIMDRAGNVLFRGGQDIKPLGDLFLLETDDHQKIVLNEKGSRAILEPVDSIRHITPSLYVFLQHDRWQLLNNTSHSVIQLRRDIQQIKDFEEDLISVKIDDQWGFIEDGGQLRIANRYDSVQYFSEGLAGYKLIGKWGFINKQEKIIVQPNYDEVHPFFGLLSKVRKENLYGLIDKSGKEILAVKYDKIERHKDYILLHSNGLVGLANRQGTVLRTPQYSEVEQLSKTNFLVSKGGKYGVISIKGLDIIPVAYDEILPFKEHFLVKERPLVGPIKGN